MEKDESASGFFRLESAPKLTTLERLLKHLNQYKELIAIVAFCVGGVLWVFGYFVTKKQFEELRCFARESIRLNRAEIKLRDTDGSITLTSRRLFELDEKAKQATLSVEDAQERHRAGEQLERLKERRRKEQDRVDLAEQQLLDNSCSAGG